MNAGVIITISEATPKLNLKVFWMRPFVSHLRAKMKKLQKEIEKKEDQESVPKRVKSEPGTKARK